MLEEGEAYAEKVFEGTNKAENVKNYTKGSYFGELALVKNEPRAASVIAKTDCKLLSLDRLSFKRLLGPIENILRRNFDAYTKYIKK
jgi:cAMP-dependent protein kinase regulator